MFFPEQSFAASSTKEILSHDLGAGIADKITAFLGWVAYYFLMAATYLILAGVRMLVAVGGYSNFIDVPTVAQGWAIVRDICNMIIVVVMLFIAFGTVLRRDDYNLKMVPRLLLFAVLINFSRTIFGLLTDASQYVMLSFISSFPSSGNGAVYVDMFSVQKLYSISSATANDSVSSALSGLSVSLAILLGMFAAFVTLVVIWVLVIVLFYRIVQLWIYTILSPLVFLGMGFAPLSKYTSQIWSDFVNQLIVGPVLALFIWLALLTAQAEGTGALARGMMGSGNCGTGDISVFFCDNELQKYILVVSLLVGGLAVSQKFAGKAAGVIGGGLGFIKKGQSFIHNQTLGRGKRLAGKAKDKVVGAGVGAAKGVGRLGLTVAGGIDRGLGTAVNKGLGGRLNSGTLAEKGLIAATAMGAWNTPGNIAASVRRKFSADEAVNKKSRDMAREKHLEENGKKYVEKDGKRWYVDSDGMYREGVKNKKNGKYDYDLTMKKGKHMLEGENKVGMMSGAGIWAYDTWNGVNGGAKAAADAAEKGRIEDVMKAMDAKGYSVAKLKAVQADISSSAIEKMAASIKLAMKEGFQTNADVEKSRGYLAGNSIMSKQFNDEILKKQAHIAYDLAKDDGKAALAGQFAKGNVDYTKQSADAFKSGAFQEIAAAYHGDEFSRIQKAAYGRGDAKTKTAIEDGIFTRMSEIETKMAENPNDEDLKKQWQLASSSHAELSGKVELSFKRGGEDGASDMNALEKYVRSVKASDLSNMGVDNYNKLRQEVGEDLDKIVRENMSISRLKQLSRIPTANPALVEKFVEVMAKDGVLAKKMEEDTELRHVLAQVRKDSGNRTA